MNAISSVINAINMYVANVIIYVMNALDTTLHFVICVSKNASNVKNPCAQTIDMGCMKIPVMNV